MLCSQTTGYSKNFAFSKGGIDILVKKDHGKKTKNKTAIHLFLSAGGIVAGSSELCWQKGGEEGEFEK